MRQSNRLFSLGCMALASASIMLFQTVAVNADPIQSGPVCLLNVVDAAGNAVADVRVSYDIKGVKFYADPQPDGGSVFKALGGKVTLTIDGLASPKGLKSRTVDVVLPMEPQANAITIVVDGDSAKARVSTVSGAAAALPNAELLRSPSGAAFFPANKVGAAALRGSSCPVGGAGDECADAIAVGDGTFAGDMADNTGSTGDDDSCGFNNTIDEWYCYTATCTGTLTVTTCSPNTTFDTIVSAFDACGGAQLACNDDTTGAPPECSLGGLNRKSTISFPVTSGNTYNVRVSSFNDDFACAVCTGTTYEITFDSDCGGGGGGSCDPAGSGDECNAPIVVGDGTFAGDLSDNTGSTGDDDSCGFNNTIDEWYCYTATCDGTATVTTCSPNTTFDTIVAAFDGCGGSELACNDDASGAPPECALGGLNRKSTISFPVTAGNSYNIRVSSFNDDFACAVCTGTTYEITFSCAMGGGGGGNDECADAEEILCNSSVIADNSSATTSGSDPGYSCHFNGPGVQGANTLWYTFVATDTSAQVSTCNTPAGIADDTLIAVYDGTCGSFTELGCSEDACGFSSLLSEVCVDGLTIGNTYYIQLASFDPSDAGSYTLEIECPCPAPPMIDCPTNGVPENEPDCGDVFGGAIDTVNGGCNSVPPVFSNVQCGDTVCGSIAQGSSFRDTDWYEVTVGVDTVFTWTATATFDIVIGYIPTVPLGVPNCATISVLEPFATGAAFDQVSITTDCLPPGTHWFFVSTVAAGTVPCPSDYVVELTCQGPCVIPTGACCLDDGTCSDPITEDDCAAQSGTYQGDGTACDDPGLTCPVTCGPGAGSCFEANGTPGCEEASCCTTVCAVDAFCCDVEWDSICADEADDLCPKGGCCLDDGSCSEVSSDTCSSLGGDYQGDGTDCSGSLFDATLTVEILTDDFGNETTFQVVNQNTGSVVASGGPFPDATLITVNVPVDSEGCYTFTIFDAFGDGICCGFGLGSYEVFFEGNSVGSGGAFGASESISDIGGCGANPPGPGACCTGDGECMVSTQTCCENAGGAFLGFGSDCSAGSGNFQMFASGALAEQIDSALPAATNTISVGPSFVVADVNVSIQATHTFLGDLEISLEHNGTTVELMNDQCGSNNDLDITFDDEGNPLVCGQPSTGIAIPLDALGAFDGMDAQGDWTLTINDDAGGDTGTLDGWSLSLEDSAGDPCCVAEACPPGMFPLVDGQGDFSGFCYTSSAPTGEWDLFVDQVIPGNLAVIEIFKEFHNPPSQLTGIIPAILFDFVQICDDEDTVNMIFIADEAVLNATGVEWADYHFSLFDGPEVWFATGHSASFSVNPFAGKTFNDFLDSPTNSKAKRLDIDGGVIPNGGAFFPGAASGELKIGIDLSDPNPISFTLKQLPTHELRGACCFSDGSCLDNIKEDVCAIEMGGGIYQGDLTSCGEVQCPIQECEHRIDLLDSFGDGWDGATIDVLVNGGVVLNDITASGSGSTFGFEAGTGDAITTVYTSGAFENEHTYSIFDGNGTLLGGDGPFPGAGIAVTGNCEPPPPCVADFVVTAPGVFAGDTTGAGDDCDLRAANDHIYEITLPSDGTWTFSLCDPDPSAWDSFIFLGTDCCSDDIAFNDDGCASFGLSTITADLTAGTYYLTIEGFGNSDFGAYELEVSLPAALSNDECDDAFSITDGDTAFNPADGTDSGPNEPSCMFPFGGAANQDINQDLWYTYVATCTGDLFIDTCEGGTIDTRLAIYDGCGCPPAGDPLECNDDHGNATEADTGATCSNTLTTLEASLSVPVTMGNCYSIRVGVFSTSGTINGADTLRVSCGSEPLLLGIPGDFDGDLDVDLVDYAAFQSCATSFGPGCEVFSIGDNGRAVGSVNMPLLSKKITGPKPLTPNATK